MARPFMGKATEASKRQRGFLVFQISRTVFPEQTVPQAYPFAGPVLSLMNKKRGRRDGRFDSEAVVRKSRNFAALDRRERGVNI